MINSAAVDRRWFARHLLFATLVTPLAAHAQPTPKIARIAVLRYGSPDDPTSTLREGLRALGYIEGQTVVVDEVFAMGRAERLPHLAAELVSRAPAVIVAYGPYASVAAKNATSTIPVVFANAHSPIELGLVASLARPGGNVTGIAWNVGPESQAKQLELLKDAIPNLERVAWISGRRAAPEARVYLEAMEAGARQLRLKLQVVSVARPEDYDPAFRAMLGERAEAIVVAGNGRNFFHRKRILDFVARHRLPAAWAWREAVEEGGFMSYGPNIIELGRRAVTYVDKILKGAKPADLPVEQPTTFELVLNSRTARALGVTIPPPLLLRADHVID